jgi:hypothetical protein
MTAKQAVKARCFDCSGRECGFGECALKGLAKSKGKVHKKAVLAYCRWCLNGPSKFVVPRIALFTSTGKKERKPQKIPRLWG